MGNAELDVDAQPTGTAPPTAGAGARAGACEANGAGAAARHMQMQSKGTTRAHKSLARFFLSTRHLFGNQKGFQTCFLHRVALLLAHAAGVGGAVITLAIAR